MIPRFLRRWWSVLIVAAISGAVTASPPVPYGPPIRADGAGYHVWTYALLRGDLTFSWYRGKPDDACLYGPEPVTNRHVCKYPPGVALVRLPVMALVVDRQWTALPFSPAEYVANLILGAVALTAMAGFGLVSARRLGVPDAYANAAVLVGVFGTGLFNYGTHEASYSHVYSALFAAALIWVGVRAVAVPRPVPIGPVCAIVLMLVLIRLTNVVLIAFWAAGVALWVWRVGGTRWGWLRPLVGAGAGLLVGAAATAWVNHTMIGRWTLNSYVAESFVWDQPMVWSVFFETEMGLFPIYPVLAVALLTGLAVPRSRPFALWLLALIGAYAVIYGHWASWHLGFGFGHRGFVELVPFAIPLFGMSLARLPTWAAWCVLLLSGCCTAYTTDLMLQYWYW